MKTFTQQLCTAVCLSSALFAGAAMATSQAQGGVIHFIGSIVEDPCNISPGAQHVSMQCYRDGKMRTSTISYHQAMDGRNVDDLASVSMRYINPQKTLGIVTVDYR